LFARKILKQKTVKCREETKIWKQKIIKNFTSKSCKQNLWEIKKIENKIYLEKQLLGTKITKICTEEFKKEKQPRGYIHNFFGGKVG